MIRLVIIPAVLLWLLPECLGQVPPMPTSIPVPIVVSSNALGVVYSDGSTVPPATNAPTLPAPYYLVLRGEGCDNLASDEWATEVEVSVRLGMADPCKFYRAGPTLLRRGGRFVPTAPSELAPVEPTISTNDIALGLPVEILAIPDLSGPHTVCVWSNHFSDWWLQEPYDLSGTYEFHVPAWGRWYWIGIWADASGEYVYGKWIGHSLTTTGD